MAADFHGSWDFLIHSFSAGLAFYLALTGALTAWFLYIKNPHIPSIIHSKLKLLVNLLEENDGSDFIFYPQIEKKTTCPILGICFINRVSTVEVKSKLGTFK